MKFIAISSLVVIILLVVVTFYPVKKSNEIPDYGFNPNETEASVAQEIKFTTLEKETEVKPIYSDVELLCSLHNVCDKVQPINDIVITPLENSTPEAHPDSQLATSEADTTTEEPTPVITNDDIKNLISDLETATKDFKTTIVSN